MSLTSQRIGKSGMSCLQMKRNSDSKIIGMTLKIEYHMKKVSHLQGILQPVRNWPKPSAISNDVVCYHTTLDPDVMICIQSFAASQLASSAMNKRSNTAKL